MGTCPHQVLAATLTLSQLQRGQIMPTLDWCPHQVLKATGAPVQCWVGVKGNDPLLDHKRWKSKLLQYLRLRCIIRKTFRLSVFKHVQKTLLKVVFIQNVLMSSSYPQTDEPNYFPELDILKSSDAASGWAGWALAHPEFGSSVHPIPTGGGGRLYPPHYCLPTRIWKPSGISALWHHWRSIV